MRAHEVVITGCGAITPHGTIPATWQALCRGESAVRPVTIPGTQGMRDIMAMSSRWFDVGREIADGRLRRMLGWASGLAVSAGVMAWRDAALDDTVALDEMATVFAVPIPDLQLEQLHGVLRGGFDEDGTWHAGRFAAAMRRAVPPYWRLAQIPNLIGYALSVVVGIRGKAIALSTACASGIDAIGLAARLVAHGEARIVVAGGGDSLLTPAAYALMHRFQLLARGDDAGAVRCRPFDRDRQGLVLSEGAGAVVLEAAHSARGRGRAPYGRLLGYGSTVCGATTLDVKSRTDGFAAAMEAALRDAKTRPNDVEGVVAYGAGTRHGDGEEADAIGKVLGSLARVPVTSTKGALGYLGAAAGSVDAIVTLLAIRDRLMPPTANHRVPDRGWAIDCVAGSPRPFPGRLALVNSHGVGGHYASLVLGRVAA